MKNTINSYYAYIMDYANKILLLKNKLDTELRTSEREKINSDIETYKTYIDTYTDNSSDFILICAQKIKSAKQKLCEESDESKKELLLCGLRTYENHIKAHITINAEKNKSSEFRQNQKSTVNDEIKELINLCNKHHDELMKKRNLTKSTNER